MHDTEVLKHQLIQTLSETSSNVHLHWHKHNLLICHVGWYEIIQPISKDH
jgi:hypothetical protein